MMFGVFREQKLNVETKKIAMPKSIQPKRNPISSSRIQWAQ
jgi:hypothetical protein